jgi:hypothetical protein
VSAPRNGRALVHQRCDRVGRYLLRGIDIRNGGNFGYQGQLENHKNGFETRRDSNFRPFSFGSSRFNVETGARNGATTQFNLRGVTHIFPGAGTDATPNAG